MLDGSGDTYGDVEVGCHHFAGLAALVVVGHEAGVDRGARGADGGAQLVGDALPHAATIAARLTAGARDDQPPGCMLRALRLCDFLILLHRATVVPHPPSNPHVE